MSSLSSTSNRAMDMLAPHRAGLLRGIGNLWHVLGRNGTNNGDGIDLNLVGALAVPVHVALQAYLVLGGNRKLLKNFVVDLYTTWPL